MIKVNTILNDSWEVVKKVGQGTFSQLFMGRNITGEYDFHDEEKSFVAIKVGSNEVDSSVIKWEAEVLKILQDMKSTPKLIHAGNENGQEYLIMEFLGGEDMALLRNRIRSTSGSGLVSLPAASYLSRQMLNGIREMHEVGYVHRDVKPANFVRRSKHSTEFCMVDFGIAKIYKDKEGRIRQKRENVELRGTTTYASPNMHLGDDHCPRDDMYSLIFVFFDLICGKLPWTEASRSKDKKSVVDLKSEYCTTCPERMIQWVAQTVKDSEILHSETCNDYDENFPLHAQEQCLTVLKHLQTLRFEDQPDYDLIEMALISVVENPSLHNVGDINYKAFGFDWGADSNINADKSQSISLFHQSAPAEQRMTILSVRVRNLSACFSANRHRSGGDFKNNPIKQWRSFVKFLKSLSTASYPLSVFDTVEEILNDIDRFFSFDFGPNDAKFQEFIDIQKDVFAFMEFKEKQNLKRKSISSSSQSQSGRPNPHQSSSSSSSLKRPTHG